MNKVSNAMDTQPVITIQTVLVLVGAFITGLTYFFPGLEAHREYILGTLVAAYPVVTAFWTYFKVFAPATVRGIIEDLNDSGVPVEG